MGEAGLLCSAGTRVVGPPPPHTHTRPELPTCLASRLPGSTCFRAPFTPLLPGTPVGPQTVEWLYAFDIHCNGFLVSFLFTHVLQFLLLPILLGDGLVATILANLLWTAALSSYFFVTHLGYRALPFLRHTEYYLYPVAGVWLLFLLLLLLAILGYRVNVTRVSSTPCMVACGKFGAMT